MEEKIIYNGHIIKFTLKRKKIKNINIRIEPNKEIIVSAPMKISAEKIKLFIQEKAKWIISKIEMYEKIETKAESKSFKDGEYIYILGNPYQINLYTAKQNQINIKEQYINFYIKEKYIKNSDYIKKIYIKWLKEYAMQIYQNLVIKYQKQMEKYNVPIPNIEIKQVKSKWGSCTPSKKQVMFNLSLIKTPIECVEYVVVHELAHFKYQNHSKEFYNFVSKFIPDWKEKRKILNKEYAGII